MSMNLGDELGRVQNNLILFVQNLYRSTDSVRLLKERASLPMMKGRMLVNSMEVFRAPIRRYKIDKRIYLNLQDVTSRM